MFAAGLNLLPPLSLSTYFHHSTAASRTILDARGEQERARGGEGAVIEFTHVFMRVDRTTLGRWMNARENSFISQNDAKVFNFFHENFLLPQTFLIFFYWSRDFSSNSPPNQFLVMTVNTILSIRVSVGFSMEDFNEEKIVEYVLLFRDWKIVVLTEF